MFLLHQTIISPFSYKTDFTGLEVCTDRFQFLSSQNWCKTIPLMRLSLRAQFLLLLMLHSMRLSDHSPSSYSKFCYTTVLLFQILPNMIPNCDGSKVVSVQGFGFFSECIKNKIDTSFQVKLFVNSYRRIVKGKEKLLYIEIELSGNQGCIKDYNQIMLTILVSILLQQFKYCVQLLHLKVLHLLLLEIHINGASKFKISVKLLQDEASAESFCRKYIRVRNSVP